MWIIIYLYLFLFSLSLSIILTSWAKKVAIKYNFLDIPGERKVHTKAKPLLGGLAIFLSFSLTIIIHLLLMFTFKESSLLPAYLKMHLPGVVKELHRVITLLLGGFLIMMVGLYDDKKISSPQAKLLSQILIATVLFMLNIRITLFINNLFISYLITCLWVIFIINSFNLLDNMDGLSAGIALVAVFIFFQVTVTLKEIFISSMLIVLAGSLLGFLFYNFNPASIFMGDCGSMFIGYIISVLTIQATYISQKSTTFLPLITPLLILAIPLYDTFSVIVIRIKNKQSIFKGDKNHFSHRLVKLGMSQKGAVLFLYLVSFALGINSVLLPYLELKHSLIIVLQALSMILIVALLEYFGKLKNGTKD